VKILAVNWRDMKNPDAGGAEVHLHEILKGLVAKGHSATLVASNFAGGSEEDSQNGIRVIRRGKWFNANFVIPMFLRSHLKRNSYDLIVEDINKIPFFTPAFTRTKVIAVIPHLFGATVFRETNPLLASYVYFWEALIPFVYQSCRFVSISPSTKDDLIGRGMRKDRIDVVLCGLDNSTYRRLDACERFETPTLVHFGRIRKYKSVDTVIRVLALLKQKLPEARLVIIGDGPEKTNLEDLTKKLGLTGSVEFSGVLSTQRLVETLNKSHVFINASPKEGWGLTVVEANACGVPVLASNRPGLKDSLRDGETGFLVEYGDVQAFAERAYQLLTDEDLWRRMSGAGILAAQSLTWERTVEEMEQIFLREISA
jgi:glycosyltransferase involved in cell wall biosynthesis